MKEQHKELRLPVWRSYTGGKKLLVAEKGERSLRLGERRDWSKALVGSLNPVADLSSSLHASLAFLP